MRSGHLLKKAKILPAPRIRDWGLLDWGEFSRREWIDC